MSAWFALHCWDSAVRHTLSHIVWRGITLCRVRETVAWWDCAIRSFPLFSVCWAFVAMYYCTFSKALQHLAARQIMLFSNVYNVPNIQPTHRGQLSADMMTDRWHLQIVTKCNTLCVESVRHADLKGFSILYSFCRPIRCPEGSTEDLHLHFRLGLLLREIAGLSVLQCLQFVYS